GGVGVDAPDLDVGVHLGARNGGHVDEAVVGRAVAGGVRPHGVDGLAEIGEVGLQVVGAGAELGDLGGGAAVDVGDGVARLEEVFDDPLAGFAAAAGDDDAFVGHEVVC